MGKENSKETNKVHDFFLLNFPDILSSWWYEIIYVPTFIVFISVELSQTEELSFNFNNFYFLLGLLDLIIPLLLSLLKFNKTKIYGLSYNEFRKLPEVDTYGVIRMFVTSIVLILIIFFSACLGLTNTLSLAIAVSILYFPFILIREIPLLRQGEKRMNRITRKILWKVAEYPYRENTNFSKTRNIAALNIIYSEPSPKRMHSLLNKSKRVLFYINFDRLLDNLINIEYSFCHEFNESEFTASIEDANSISYKDINILHAVQINLDIAKEIATSNILIGTTQVSKSSESLSKLIIYSRKSLERLQVCEEKEKAFVDLITHILIKMNSDEDFCCKVLQDLSISAIYDRSTWFVNDLYEAYSSFANHLNKTPYFYVYNAIYYYVVDKIFKENGITYDCIDSTEYDSWYSFIKPIFDGKSRSWFGKLFAFLYNHHSFGMELLEEHTVDTNIKKECSKYRDDFIAEWWFNHALPFCLY